jgi:catechol 2,3-dioxygenase-like lactoylglutathione lyase family enzyme
MWTHSLVQRRHVGKCEEASTLTATSGRSQVDRYARRVLHHLTLWVPDLERAEESWSWLLGNLGYLLDRSLDRFLLFRHRSGFALALEQSSDMVPGMLYSRFRPGLNHLAFTLESESALTDITSRAAEYGWSALPVDRHPIASAAEVTYLEDRDGFEVELVAPLESSF